MITEDEKVANDEACNSILPLPPCVSLRDGVCEPEVSVELGDDEEAPPLGCASVWAMTGDELAVVVTEEPDPGVGNGAVEPENSCCGCR